MKTKRFLCLCMVLITLGTMNVQAQGLGGLLKKVKKGVDKVTSMVPSTTTQAGVKKTKGLELPVEGGGTITNPLPGIVDIQLVGAYGKTTSANYGTVGLVFKVKMISNLKSMSFGCNVDYPAIMVDQDGNTYKPAETAGWYSEAVTEGVPMRVSLEHRNSAIFVDVKRSVSVISQLQIGVSTSYQDRGLIVLKNVPIQWDVEH